jgi:hypothetical protein
MLDLLNALKPTHVNVQIALLPRVAVDVIMVLLLSLLPSLRVLGLTLIEGTSHKDTAGLHGLPMGLVLKGLTLSQLQDCLQTRQNAVLLHCCQLGLLLHEPVVFRGLHYAHPLGRIWIQQPQKQSHLTGPKRFILIKATFV